MHVALEWTVSDFPGFSMLFGWKTKGRWTCPCYNHDTCSQYLKYSRKTCYMGHRRFLDMNHAWRFNETSFNGGREDRCRPSLISGTEAFKQVEQFKNDFGKKRKQNSSDNEGPWKKGLYFLNCHIGSIINVVIT